jgi:hypothetical protein
MNYEAIISIILVILWMVISLWAIQDTNGYYILCDHSFGRTLSLIFIVLLTSIDKLYGLLAILVYMCIYMMHLLNNKYKYNQDYVDRYFNLYPNPEILTHNVDYTGPIISPDEFVFQSSKTDNMLFYKNQEIMNNKIKNESSQRSLLVNLLYPNNSRQNNNYISRKVSPSEENTHSYFNPNFLTFQSFTNNF